MKNDSYELKKNNYGEDIISYNNKRTRAHSNVSSLSCFNKFIIKHIDNYQKNETNICYRNKNTMSSLLSLKQTEKDEIMKGINNLEKKIKQTKKVVQKKKFDMKNIFNNIKGSSKKKIKAKSSSSSKSKLNYKNHKYNSTTLSNRSYNKNSNKSNRLKRPRLNTFNNQSKKKYNINVSFINNSSFSKYDKMINTINNKYSNKDYYSTNINSNPDNNTSSIITFGNNQSNRISSEYIYVKKNCLCFINSKLNKPKNSSYFNNDSFARTLDKNINKNTIQKVINDVNISEFRVEEDKDSEDYNLCDDIYNINDTIEDENINKINVSHNSKFKTIEQIEKKIKCENVINRIINHNINKKTNIYKNRQNNNEERNSSVLNTATFGLMETEKKY